MPPEPPTVAAPLPQGTPILAVSGEELGVILGRAIDAILVLQDDRVAYWNGGYAARLGYALEEVVGQPVDALVAAEQQAEVRANYARRVDGDAAPAAYDVRLRTKAGALVTVEAHASRIHFRGRPAVLVVARDVTERRALERRLHALATRDELTTLLNRRAFLAAVDARRPAGGALLFLDLDDFKQPNDHLGHATGDAILRETARRITATLGPRDLAARWGGDEFALYLPLAPVDAAWRTARAVVAAIAQPVPLPGTSLVLHASVGLAPDPGPPLALDVLLAHADAAMYRAKAAGGQQVVAA